MVNRQIGLDILVNRESTGATHRDGILSGFAYCSGFTINSGFIEGKNTLTFLVRNAPLDDPNKINPTGRRVETSGTAAPVPEPATVVVMLSGLVGLRQRRVRAYSREAVVGGKHAPIYHPPARGGISAT